MVSDTGGVNDRSFNQSAWAGMTEAASADRRVHVRYLQSVTPADYTPDIDRFVTEKCTLIVTVGYRMGPATATAAAAYPRQEFAIVDCSYAEGCLPGEPRANVAQMVFNTAQAGFLGGYLAAGLTRTGKVATFGGILLPTVTIYEDGFWDGVTYYNQVHHARVAVLGWDEQTQQGTFSGDFTTAARGARVARQLIAAGADILFPLAGTGSLGAAQAVAAADKTAGYARIALEWVDTDGCEIVPQYCPYMITSVVKNITGALATVVVAAANGDFQQGTYLGSLTNDGTGLAPFHAWLPKIPVTLQAQLAQLETSIGAGQIQVATASPVS